MNARTSITLCLLTSVMLCTALTGCVQFGVPAIDPTGRRLFLPRGSYTTINSPGFPGCKPAFTTPPPPPPCPGQPALPNPTAGPVKVQPQFPLETPPPGATIPRATAPVVSATTANLQPGQLLLAPVKRIAAVGSEVILVAGLLNSRRTYQPRQYLEWTLSQDSVGHLVATDDHRNAVLKHIFHKPENKRDAGYARTRTSVNRRVLTRGTPNTTDDMTIHAGQSWLTITSPTEGASHIHGPGTGKQKLGSATADRDDSLDRRSLEFASCGDCSSGTRAPTDNDRRTHIGKAA